MSCEILDVFDLVTNLATEEATSKGHWHFKRTWVGGGGGDKPLCNTKRQDERKEYEDCKDKFGEWLLLVEPVNLLHISE